MGRIHAVLGAGLLLGIAGLAWMGLRSGPGAPSVPDDPRVRAAGFVREGLSLLPPSALYPPLWGPDGSDLRPEYEAAFLRTMSRRAARGLPPPWLERRRDLEPRYEQALVRFRAASDHDPDDPMALGMRSYVEARLLALRERPPDASALRRCEADLGRAIDGNRQNDRLWLRRGMVRMILASVPGEGGALAGAESDLDHAIRLFPDSPEAFLHRAAVRAMRAGPAPDEPGWPWDGDVGPGERAALLEAARRDLRQAMEMPGGDPQGAFLLELVEQKSASLAAAPAEATPERVFERAKDSVLVVRHARAVGSGFVAFRSAGFAAVLTNRHVVEGAPDGKVRLLCSGNRSIDATVYRTSRTDDLAVILVPLDQGNAGALPVLREFREGGEGAPVGAAPVFQPSAAAPPGSVRVGQRIVVIGHPAIGEDGTQLAWTMTTGTVSNIHGEDCIQVDAAVNPGNSGGPVLNLKGQVVGVATGVGLGSGGAPLEGTAFCIPFGRALAFARDCERSYLSGR